MTREAIRIRIGKLRTENQSRINDIYIWSSVAILALDKTLKDHTVLNQDEFPVPSNVSSQIVNRTPQKIKAILHSASSRDLYSAILLNVVAQVEAFLNDVITEVLRFDNRRLKQGVPGLERQKHIEIEEVLDSSSKEALIDSIIDKVLTALFYASPSIQFEYFERVIGIKITDSRKRAWCELKATRDLIVHNSGRINEIYLKKADSSARGSLGEIVDVDKKYFEQSIAQAKSLIGNVSSQLQKEFKSKPKT